jgi:hypothetical protein
MMRIVFEEYCCSTQTHVDLQNSVMGNSLQFQQQYPPALSIQDSLIHSECTLAYNHRIHEDLQMNTLLSEIEMWNTKHLRKLENRTNALTVPVTLRPIGTRKNFVHS